MNWLRCHLNTWWGGVLTALVLTAGVAGCAGALSFNALRVLAVSVYLPAEMAWLYPLAVDGMLGVATLAAVLHRTSPLRTRAYIWVLIAAAIGISVSGNALHATGHGGDVHLPDLMAALASAVPAASLAAALHLFVIVTRSPRRHAEDIELPVEVPHEEPPTLARTRAVGAHDEQPNGRIGARRNAQPAARKTRSSRARIQAMLKHAQARGQELDAQTVATRLKVTSGHARRLLADARQMRTAEEA